MGKFVSIEIKEKFIHVFKNGNVNNASDTDNYENLIELHIILALLILAFLLLTLNRG